MPELNTRFLLDGGEFWEGHTLLCPECEDPFDYVHPVCVDVDRGAMSSTSTPTGWAFGTRPRAPRGVIIRVDFVCENGHQFALRLQFYKGQTLLGASTLPPAPVNEYGAPDIRTPLARLSTCRPPWPGGRSMHYQPRRARSGRAADRRLSTANETFVAFDHTARGKSLERLCADDPALHQADAAVLRAVRNDRLPLCVSSGWVLLPPGIAASLSPLSFDLERRVLSRYPRRELPVKLQSQAYTGSQVRGVPAAVRPDAPGAARLAARGLRGTSMLHVLGSDRASAEE